MDQRHWKFGSDLLSELLCVSYVSQTKVTVYVT